MSELIGGLVGLAFIVYLSILGFYSITGVSKCLAHGYPGHKADWALNQYCVKRVDQTDVVVPLEQAQRPAAVPGGP